MSYYRQPMRVKEIKDYWKVSNEGSVGRQYELERRLRVLKDQRETFAAELKAFDKAIKKDKEDLKKLRGGKSKRGV